MEKELKVRQDTAAESCCDPVCGPETCGCGPTQVQPLIQITPRRK